MSKEVNYRSVRGMKDLHGEEILKYNFIIDVAKRIATKYNFQLLQTPIVEYSNLFDRNLGDESDIVSKEVYRFDDRSGESLTLRPEFTASVARFIIENGLYYGPFPRKYFTHGSVYRYDRPQKGRQREFNQLNFEIFGINNSLYYHYYLEFAIEILQNLGIEYKLEINHLGQNQENRQKYILALQQYLQKFYHELSADSQRRLSNNVLRILDSKDKNDQAILDNAPSIHEFLTQDEQSLIQSISSQCNATWNRKLVRGLDYYTGLVFEFSANLSESQNAICGGGEYNNLILQMSGKHQLSAFGFAFGIERLMLLLNSNNKVESTVKLICIIQLIDSNDIIKFSKNYYKNQNVKLELCYSSTLEAGLKQANKFNADYAIFLKDNMIIEKNMQNGEQINISADF